VLGRNWESIRSYFRGADVVIGVVIVIAFVIFLYHHLKPERENSMAK
jgi:hypothetical protein